MIRRICVIRDSEKAALDAILYAEARGEEEFREALRAAYDKGLIKPLSGSIEDFEKAFFGYFDPKPVGLPPLSVR